MIIGIGRVVVHADLTMLGWLATALTKTSAGHRPRAADGFRLPRPQ
jgi:hypothetical protein